MEQDGFYLRVGVFVSILLVVAVMIIGAFNASGPKDEYETYGITFKGAVDGLGIGSPVRFKGITIGTVKTISFSPKEQNQILVLVNVLKTAPIHNSTVATMQMLGITGTSYISLTDTGADPTPKTINPGEDYPMIASIPSSLEKVFDNIPSLIEEANKLSVRGQALLSDDNIAAVNHTLTSLDESAQALQDILGSKDSQSIASTIVELNETLAEAKLTLREYRMLARTIREDPSVIIHGVQHQGKELPHE
jgi:phospholipid/cholesterol/gamma-HCH transport system substrate-binding protein